MCRRAACAAKLASLNRYLLPPRLAGRVTGYLAATLCALLLLCRPAVAQHDLSLFRVSSDVFVAQGDVVSMTFVVTNDLGTDVDDVSVQLDVPPGLVYLDHTLSQSFDPVTGVWVVGDIAYYQPQRVITVDFRVAGEGVMTVNAEIAAMSGTDIDSTPANGDPSEDDAVAACVTAPIRAECGQSVRLTAASGHASYEWYKDGALIAGATGPTLDVAASGDYNFKIPGVTTTCPLGSCCPARVTFDSISVSLSQPQVCTGGQDTSWVSVPPADDVNFAQAYTWSSPDDPLLNFLTCTTCAEPGIAIGADYPGDSLRYLLSVVTTDLAGNVVCSANATLVIAVWQAPAIQFQTPAYACADVCADIAVGLDLPHASIAWDGPNLRSADGLIMNYCPRPVADYTAERFVVTVVGADGCVRIDSTTITTMPAFALDARVGDPRVCQRESADLLATLTPAQPQDSVSVTWTELPGNPNAGLNLVATDALAVTTAALDPGDYGFRVSVQRLAPDGTYVCAYEETVTLAVLGDCAQPRLGGYAWKDLNADGRRQPFEALMAGVQVELYRESGVSTGMSATTDAAGFYEFTGLDVGRYAVQFQPLPLFAFAPQNVGGDEFLDSDADATGRSDLFDATYDETVHLVGTGYVADCAMAFVDVATTPAECGADDGSLSFAVANAVGGLRYEWVPAVSATNTVTGVAAGDYVVTVYDSVTQCSYSETLTVPGSSNYRLTTSSSPAACPLGSAGTITLFTDGGVGPFTVEYAGTDAGTQTAPGMPFTLQDLRGGQYVVTVTDGEGCTQSDQVEVGESELLLSVDTANVVLAGCNGARDGRFEVVVGAYAGSYTLTLDGLTLATAATQPSIPVTGQAAGVHVLVATDENGCSRTLVFELLDTGTPIDTAGLLVTDVLCHGTATGTIASQSGQALEVRNSAGALMGTLPQNALPADAYTLVSRAGGCLQTYDVVIAEPAPLAVFAAAQDATCGLDDARIAVTVEGGLAPYTFAWSDASLPATQVVTGLAGGRYELTVRDANGCEERRAIVVSDGCTPLVCADFFTADTLVYHLADPQLAYCLPNFDVATGRTFGLDGADIATEVCTRSELTYYNLSNLPGDGEAGPYVIEFWYGGASTVLAEVVTSGAEFARALDEADAWGRWRYDAASATLRGGQPNREYGYVEVTDVPSGQTFYLTPERLANQLSAQLPLSGHGTYTVTTTNPGDGCADTLVVVLAPELECPTAYQPTGTSTATPYCDGLAPVCVDVPFALLATHTLEVDGAPYLGDAEACAQDDVVYYELDGLSDVAPFRLESWVVDGRFESSRVVDFDELAARMAAFDTEPWRYDPYLGVVRGGSAGRDYLDLTLRIDGASVRLSPKRGLSDGSLVALPTGVNALALVGPDGCATEFTVTVTCSATSPPAVDTVRWPLAVGYSDTLCVPRDQVPGDLASVENLCFDASGENADVELLDATCFVGLGLAVGSDTLCVVVCDENRVCDTTIVIAEVRDPDDVLYPLAVDDQDSVRMNGTLLSAILGNDDPRGPVTSLEVIRYPMRGNAGIEQGQLRYDPDPAFCGVDSLRYELCNDYGCDTATVELLVVCDQLIIYSGFSPNFDDVNETFTVLGVEQFPDNTMEVFNRWGNPVFRMDGYDNSWEGTYFDGEPLPEGTYFYVFEDGEGTTYTGYVYLKR